MVTIYLCSLDLSQYRVYRPVGRGWGVRRGVAREGLTV